MSSRSQRAGLPALAAAAALIVAPATASAAGPAVTTMIVGPQGTLYGPRSVDAAATAVAVAGRRCRIGAATPLSALSAAYGQRGPSFSLRDYGACSTDPADAGQLFVTTVGGFVNRGQNGWEYKVDERAGSTGAADPSGAFGNGRLLRTGDSVLWFWCDMTANGGCQRTLVIAASSRVGPGGRLAVTVQGDDNDGRGVPIRGATVTLAGAGATTDARGQAVLSAPRSSGSYPLNAQAPGLVPAFPEAVSVT